MPDDEPDPNEHPLEALLAEALLRRDRDGDAAAERFVAAHPEHAGRLREALVELGRTPLGGVATSMPAQIGDYRILGRLGEGGMGVVYLAEQLSLGREVALKVVRPELLLFEGARERFQREIDAVARLDDPAIVPILATGSTDGVPWYAMPRLRGVTAEAAMRAQAGRSARELRGSDLLALLPGAGDDPVGTHLAGVAQRPWWWLVTRLLLQAAHGIRHAHTRGVLHRDLKPANVMLTTDGRAVVLDFGLALARDDARLTRSGPGPGSPAYMAPELVRGEGADERTDVYGLGATLHSLLGLEPPFAIDAPEQLPARILAGERRSLRGRTGAPPELLLVIDTAMDVERSRRYPSAAALADDLAAVLDQRAIVARSLPWSVRGRRFLARHRAWTTAVGAALLVALAMPPILLWQQRAANEALAQQVARADRSTEATLDAIDGLLANVALPRLRNLPAVQTVAAELLDDALAQFARLAGDERHATRVQLLRQRTLFDIAQLATTLGHHDKSRASLAELLTSLQAATTPAQRLLLGRANRLLAWLEMRDGNLEASEAALTAARRAFVEPFPPALAVAATADLADLADVSSGIAERRGDRAGVVRAARERVAILESLGSRSPGVELFFARMALGANLRDAGERVEARSLLESVVAALASTDLPELGWPVPRLTSAMAQHELASLENDEQHLDAAAALGDSSLKLFDALVRDYPDDPTLRRQRGRVGNLLASVMCRTDRAAEARPILERAIADQDAVLLLQPDDALAQRYLAAHLRTQLVCLRSLGDWPALELAARRLGGMTGSGNTGRAARDLLRCAARLTDQRRAQLCDEAVALLQAAVHDDFRLDAADPVYAPVRDDARFRALTDTTGKRR